ncbi:MAG TPA: hypothetical protein VFQ68_40505 [Streptosporangiaceae bacterium]|nr:hypothetical protein [Streptosporangiaceae bacterium]
MSSTASAAAAADSSTIDEQLRLRIAGKLAGSFKGEDGHRYYTKEAL